MVLHPSRRADRRVQGALQVYDESDGDAEGAIDMKEFLLGVANFSSMTRPQKCDLVFELFDEDKNGTLTVEELTEVLKAAHMAQNESKSLERLQRSCARQTRMATNPLPR